MAGELTGKTALITGAGRGVGRAIAMELARADADVLLAARSADELAGTAAAIRTCAGPGSMVGRNVYATKAALEAHTRNLAAELAGTGVTVNVYRPGGVDTAMQAWIRAQDPERIGGELHQRFVRSYADGTLITPAQSAAALIGHLLGPDGDQTGSIWSLTDTVGT